MTKSKIDKTNRCVFGYNTCRKNEPEACFYLFPRCRVKPKYVFIENVFGFKDRVERGMHGKVLYYWENFDLMKGRSGENILKEKTTFVS
jgi:hypothetical protein